MCGEASSRSSRGGLMAAMFPFQETGTTTSSGFVLSLSNSDSCNQTRATLSTSDNMTLRALRGASRFTMRIEKYGDFMNTRDLEKTSPLFSFELDPQHDQTGRVAFDFPRKLDFEVSDSGIVGRQATLLSPSDGMGAMDIMWKGIIGWN